MAKKRLNTNNQQQFNKDSNLNEKVIIMNPVPTLNHVNRTDFEDKKILKPEEPLPQIKTVIPDKINNQDIKKYHGNPDWNYILSRFYENPTNPDFKPYVVRIETYLGKINICWNGKRIEP